MDIDHVIFLHLQHFTKTYKKKRDKQVVLTVFNFGRYLNNDVFQNSTAVRCSLRLADSLCN
jgi:hypothetical protein